MYSIKYILFLVVLLCGAALAAHGWSLDDGLFLDDHWHLLRLQDADWSLRGLTDASTIKPDRFMHTWWQQRPIEWQYPRPVSILAAKIVYQLSGGSVKTWHGLSLLLHVLSTFMVHHLCLRLTRSRFWSVVGALLFVVYSHSVYAVGWLAAQNSVIQTTLMLASLLCYLKASGLDLYAVPAEASPAGNRGRLARWLALADIAGPVAKLRPGWLAVSALLCLLAVLARESAVVLPALLVAMDLAFGGWRWCRSRWPGYLLFAVMLSPFLIWRLAAHAPMPEFYFHHYDGPGYILWWIAKLLHWLTAAVWLSPLMIGPTARYAPFSESPRDIVLMLVILGVMFAGYYLACRRAKGWWIWPLWILLAILPVVPVFAGPHSGYPPAVGFAVGMVLGPALRRRVEPRSIGRWSPGIALWFLIATIIYMPIYRTMWGSVLAAERYTIADVSRMPFSGETRHVFFMNLPFVNVYARLHLAEVRGERAEAGAPGEPARFDTHVLTFANNVLKMDQPCRLEQLDDYSFSLSIEGRPYFSGAMGRFLIESMREDGRFQQGQIVHGDLFDVEITRASTAGVEEMVFRFHEPLSSPGYAFYIGTNRGPAARVLFFTGTDGAEPKTGPVPGIGPLTRELVEEAGRRAAACEFSAVELLFEAAGHDDEAIREAGQGWLREVATPVAESLAAPVQDVFTQPEPGREDWARAGAWWRRFVTPEQFAVRWCRRDELASLRQMRDKLFGIREIASWVIHSDLYLTGPSFPDPR